MQLAVPFFQRGEQARDFFIFADVAHISLGPRQRQNQILRLLLQPLVLVSDGELHTRGMKSLRDRPRDGTLVGNSEDDTVAALQIERHACSLEWERISGQSEVE